MKNSHEYFFVRNQFLSRKSPKKLEIYWIINSQSGIKKLKEHFKKHGVNFGNLISDLNLVQKSE